MTHTSRRTSRQMPALAVGLMSGTSADGIDAVVAQLRGHAESLRVELLAHVHEPFPPRLRARILDICNSGSVAGICELNFEMGERFSAAALAVVAQAKLAPKDVLVIGSHGQTIHHLPRAKHSSTLQIGEPCVIAERTGITTVADFRVRDMATGGQGAPLVPYADWVLFRDLARPTVVQNIGGIGNLTYLPPKAELSDVLAFDTGPGNMVIDALMVHYTHGAMGFDKDGRWAAKGKVSEQLLSSCLRHPFLRRVPPKTTGREEFGTGFVSSILKNASRLRLNKVDVIATVTAFTARTIALALERYVWPKAKAQGAKSMRVILGGGGAANPTLRGMLQRELPTVEWKTHKDFGVPDAAKEALAFAILGYESIAGLPSNVPSATGASRSVVLGKIVPA